VEEALLSDEFPNLHLGTINHCMFDAPQAECQDELPEDQRGLAPSSAPASRPAAETRPSPEPMPRTGSPKKTT
jgi:hypothetical protein